ncbi:diacylglycerol kinase family protein [Parafilimonas sp.]|uniref:diacylglycerol kinase family protein n=1 Tax=Parafilimonas sp. TaxID=1969739 RepID=UPI0039E2F73F
MTQNSRAIVYRQALNKTFTTALNGICYFFKTERNGKIQAVVALFTILAACALHISAIEWVLVLFCIASVIALEMVNTALEHLCNHVHEDYHPSIKIIKDVAAGAVLFASIISVITGLIIFIPKILPML